MIELGSAKAFVGVIRDVLSLQADFNKQGERFYREVIYPLFDKFNAVAKEYTAIFIEIRAAYRRNPSMTIEEIFSEVEYKRDLIVSARSELKGLVESLAHRFDFKPLFPGKQDKKDELLKRFSWSIRSFFVLSDIDNSSMASSFLKSLRHPSIYFYTRAQISSGSRVTPQQIHHRLDEIIRGLEKGHQDVAECFGEIRNLYLSA